MIKLKVDKSNHCSVKLNEGHHNTKINIVRKLKIIKKIVDPESRSIDPETCHNNTKESVIHFNKEIP